MPSKYQINNTRTAAKVKATVVERINFLYNEYLIGICSFFWALSFLLSAQKLTTVVRVKVFRFISKILPLEIDKSSWLVRKPIVHWART